MCETSRTAPTPRWGALYGLLVLAFAAAVIVRLVAPPWCRGPVSWGIGLATVSGVVRWIGWNRVAFDQSEWCACASASVRMRTIHPVREQPLEPVEIEEEDRRGATLVV